MTYLCPECGRELEKGEKCPECGKKAKGYDLLKEPRLGRMGLFKNYHEVQPNNYPEAD